jgi:tetratricopeptide (TPR) repeat protein
MGRIRSGPMSKNERPEFEDQKCTELWGRASEEMSGGDWNSARDTLETLFALVPESAQVANKIGVCFAQLNQLEAAEKAFQKANSLDPRFAQALSNLGNIALQRGELENAADLYRQAIREDPDYSVAHHNLSAAYRRLGQIEKSVEELKKARALEVRMGGPQGYSATGDEPKKPAKGLLGCAMWGAAIIIIVLVIILLK